MKRKILLTFALALVLLCSTALCYAASTTETQCADALYELGLFSGTGTNADGTPIYSLDRVPTRQEAAAMLVRLLGKDSEAKSAEYDIPFTDVDAWAKPYVGYLYQNGLTSGTSATTFGGNAKISANQYLTFVLRALGYDDKAGDFTWDKAYKLANKIGISSGEYDSESAFDRGNLVSISYMALKTNVKDEDKTLLEELYAEKAVSSKTIADVDVPKYRIEFDELLDEVNEERIADIANKESFEGFENYLQHKSGEVDITQDELDSLLNTSNAGKSTLTYDEAVYDIDLYFRALKYGYGGYYYFGEESFNNAEQTVLKTLEGKETISKAYLTRTLQSAMSFVRDGHFSVDGISAIEDESVRYEYYYSDVDFVKDNNGYYTLIDGERYYYSGCDNVNVEMSPFLSTEGQLTYRLRQFCPTTIAHTKDSLTLQTNNTTRNITVTWTLSKGYNKNSNVDYNYFKENGIAYVSVRRFDKDNDDSILSEYVNSGSSLKDAKLIIYDIRANSGGSDSYPKNWVKNLTGQQPVLKSVWSTWHNYLWSDRGGMFGKEEYSAMTTDGKLIDNDIPVIILVDDYCGSSGESALMYARAMNNSIVIGSNSAGYQLCGNVKSYCLPNSGMNVSFSQSLGLVYDTNNVDGIGYEPDIWCNASDALASVINMLSNYDLSDSQTINSFKAYAIAHTSDYGDSDIYFEVEGVGRFRNYTAGLYVTSAPKTLNIIYQDKINTQYSISNSNDDVINVSKNSKGQMVVTPIGEGYSTITIKIGNASQQFLFRVRK